MKQPVYYMQTDPKWKNSNYSAKGETKTIGTSGCGVACTAMVIATLKDPKVTPVETANWSMQNGYKALNQGTYYSYFIPQLKKYGIECKRLNTSNLYGKSTSTHHTEALNTLKNGDWLIACMGKGNWTSGGHFILVYGYEDGYVYINDPYSKSTKRIKNTWDLFAKQIKYLWAITVPESFKEQDNNKEDIKILYCVQLGAYSVKSNANNFLKKVKKNVPDAFITKVNGMYKIQVGAYSIKENAEKQLQKMKKLGYTDAFIATK